MTLWAKLKTGFCHPRKTLMYLALGPQGYYTRAQKAVSKAKGMERNIKPDTPLELHMVKPTDIHEHLATLYMLTVELNLKRIVELGTRGGESTIALLEAAKQIGGRVCSIDIDPCLQAKAKVRVYELQKYWMFIQGDDLEVKWEKPIDHLFIDTTHTFDQTIKELGKYEPYVEYGGIMTFHDIVLFPEVLRAVNSCIKGKTNLRLYRYFNNNGLAVVFKGHKSLTRY